MQSLRFNKFSKGDKIFTFVLNNDNYSATATI